MNSELSRQGRPGLSQLKNFARKQPLPFAVSMILVGIFLTEIPLRDLLAPYFGLQPAHYLTIVLEQSLTGALFFVLLARIGWLRLAGFTPPRQWQALWLGWPLLVFTLINIEASVVVDTARPGLIALHLLTVMSTGWVEEVLCRGVVVTALLQSWGRQRRGIYLAVLVSSALFGAAHLANYLMGRKPLLNSVVQTMFSIFFGVVFAACVLRNCSIWPAIFLHAAVDWAATLPEIAVGGGLRTAPPPISLANAAVSVLITLPLLFYGLFILRRVEPDSRNLERIA